MRSLANAFVRFSPKKRDPRLEPTKLRLLRSEPATEQVPRNWRLYIGPAQDLLCEI